MLFYCARKVARTTATSISRLRIASLVPLIGEENFQSYTIFMNVAYNLKRLLTTMLVYVYLFVLNFLFINKSDEDVSMLILFQQTS